MALIIEDGSGVAEAEAYHDAQFVTDYLTARGRETENSWSTLSAAQQEAAIRKATDFVEKRFRRRFKGQKLHLSIDTARTVLEFAQNAADSETITLGSVTYTFVATLSGAADEILIGDSASQTLNRLVLAVGADPSAVGVYVGAGTVQNPDVTAGATFGDRVVVYAQEPGTGGNGVSVSTTVTGAAFTFSTTRGGSDTGAPQPLSFPRRNLFDYDGRIVVGVPTRLKQACSEYAVRAAASELVSDPTFDASGRQVLSERVKVGPIEEEKTYEPSGAVQLQIYPAADGLLQEYLNPAGGVFR